MSDAAAVGMRIFAELKDKAIGVWDKLPDADRKLLEDCAVDAGRVAVDALAGKDVTDAWTQINAQLANLKLSAKIRAADALWNIAADILERAATLVIK